MIINMINYLLGGSKMKLVINTLSQPKSVQLNSFRFFRTDIPLTIFKSLSTIMLVSVSEMVVISVSEPNL